MASLGELERRSNIHRAQVLLFEFGGEHSLHRSFDIFDQFVDDGVGANLDFCPFGLAFFDFPSGFTLNPTMMLSDALARSTSLSVIAPTPE